MVRLPSGKVSSLSQFFLFCALFASPLYGATFTWDGGSGDWNTTTMNWNSGTAVWSNSNDAMFSVGPGSDIITLTQNITAGTITFTNDFNTLTGSTGRSLTFNSLVDTSLSVFIDDELTLNAAAANALSAGTQEFYSTSSLNATTASAINGGVQSFNNSSALNAMAASALNGGTQSFNNTSTLSASVANAVSGGVQNFFSTSSLNASAANAVSGGAQNFSSSSSLNASAANAISGGTQSFYNTSTLNASVSNAVSGGTQYFLATGSLTAGAANAISGGAQNFFATSSLNANVTNAVSGSVITLFANSFIQVNAANALTSTVAVNFDSSSGGPGGTMRLNGNSTSIGQINSSGIAGVIENASVTAATFTVNSALDSNFSGVIQNGTGGGALALVKTGSGALTLTGANTYSGGTTISQGTALINNVSGSAFGTGNVVLAAAATLTGGGAFTGNLDVSGTYSPGDSPGTSTTGSQTWQSGGNFLFEINNATGTPGSDPGWDLADINGTLSISSTVFNPFTLSITSLGLDDQPGQAVNFNNTNNYIWTIATTTGGISGNLNAISINTSDFQNALVGSFFLQISGNDLQLVYVPEPSTWILFILSLGGLFWLRKRSRLQRLCHSERLQTRLH